MKDVAPAPAQRGPIGRLIMDNLPLKFLAALLSVALFSLVHSDTDAQRSLYVDVVALLPPPHAQKMLVSSLPSQVRVTLRGSRSRISALQRDDFAPIQIDLREASRRYYYFDRSAVDVSGAAQVVAIDPPVIELVWATSAERKVPVRPRLRGTPDEGSMVKRPVVLAPAVITIHGPADDVKAIGEVFTEEISVEGLSAGAYDRRAQLEPLHGHVAYVEQAAADVHLEIVPALGERVLRRLDVAVLGAGEANVRPTAVSISLRGPIRGLADLEADQVVPYVDLAGLGVGPVTSLNVKVRGLPEGFEITRIVPPGVLVKRTK